MRIDIEDGYIKVIDTSKKFSSIYQSQLRYFGFIKISNTEFISKTDNPTELIEKIIGYFLENGEILELSNACKELVGSARTRKELFYNLLMQA